MRTANTNVNDQTQFASYLLTIGDGVHNPAEPNGDPDVIRLPPTMLADSLQHLLNSVFGANEPDMSSARAILAPRNDVVFMLNEEMLKRKSGETKVYYSTDSLPEEHRMFQTF